VTEKVERKLREVKIAEYRYRHEAEFAAGFLEEAGIPYRLQTDDAGGAGLGLSMLHPSVLWVRGADADLARDLVGLEPDDAEPELPRTEPEAVRMPRREGVRLTGIERAVSTGLAATMLAVAPNLPPMPYRGLVVAACALSGLLLLGAAVLGRARGRLGGLIQMLSGSPPR
jgi:hypothetical protein